MNATKSCGLDGVPFHAIVSCFAVIGPHLLRIVNLPIRPVVFPDHWKIACIVPIPKSGDPDIPSNNRPISLLSTLSKILEKVVCTKLSDYLRDHHLLSPSQCAYRPRHSTEDAVLDAVERLVTNTDNGLVSAVTTLDLSKAFDSVDHDLLITKLSWYGITDTKWFRSYLSDRHQTVRGGTLTLPVSCGVPQGSILGPILFVLFTCDLPPHLTHGHLISYADDSHHIDSAQPNSMGLSALKERLELTMNELHAWFSANSLKMNETKTNFMLVGTKSNIKKTNGFTLEINGSTLKSSAKLTFLGVVIDSHLSWEAHISQVVKKCNYILVSFYRLRHYFTKDALKLLIEAFAFTHIFYCLCVWGGANKTQLDKIQKLINFSARIVTGVKKYEHISPSLASLNWPRIEQLVAQRDVIKIFTLLTDPTTPASSRALLVPREAVSTRPTRASESRSLQLPLRELTSSQRHFSFRAVAAWNALSREVRACDSMRAFKRQI